MSGALAGIRVVDLTGVGMGPLATQMLADMGADVIKVESADGDVFRHVTPQRHAVMSHAFLNFNRNKRSIVVDLKDAGQHAEFMGLLETADVFVSNLRAAALARLGLDPASLTARMKRLIHCSCYGYSERGPYAGRAAIDDTIQAACGLAWLQGDAGASAPTYVKSVIADKVVALYVAQAVTAALYSRERTGRGQAIEVPMFECMVAFMSAEHLAGKTFVPPLGDTGYSRLLNAFRKPMRTLDGYLGVVPYTSGQWRRFFALAGDPALADDERYASATARSRHFSQLYAYVETTIASRSTADWVAALATADIPYAPVKSLDDLIDDEHLNAIGFWRRVEHPTEGSLLQAGPPIHFSGTPCDVTRHAPGLGEHTADLMGHASDARSSA
ncbi:CoA transferase [soil metagenome]